MQLHAQDDMASKMRNRKTTKTDSTLQHRKQDSITINFRYLDSSRLNKFDSSIFDFTKKYPVPWSYIDLGNFGTAARNLIFSPRMQSGWDPGWHAYDIYLATVEETRFYNTTKPYTELGYLLGSKNEQYINITHTQNITPSWNAAIQYRLINSPGTFQNQNTNHNNYRLSSWYQSDNKRYQAFLVVVASKLQASENGGLQNISDLDSNTFSGRTSVPVNLGNNSLYAEEFFANTINTGTTYSTATYFLRQQYDIIGKKDSIVTDTTVIPLFYPQFRAEYNIQYSTYKYAFNDGNPDSLYYANNYNYHISSSPYAILFVPSTYSKQDYWRRFINDFSLYQFPDSKNPQQFLKAGISFEYLGGIFDSSSTSFYNVFLHGEYRNKTRNQKWDIEANGKFYVNGSYGADYNAYISLRRFVSKDIGFLQLGFQNANESQPFVYNRASSFSFGIPSNFNKENITNLFAALDQPKLHLRLSGNYYLITNYNYFTDYYKENQQSSPFNILQIKAEKVFRLTKYWIWRASVIIQQKAGASPVNMPLLLTHNQFGYEGNFGFRNLDISFGLEFRYYTGYKPDNYSPLTGQFFTQNDTTIKQHLPDITGYVHFRIRSFTAYVRAENLNTAQYSALNGFGFTNYNFPAPNYPDKGLQIRLGIFWTFIN
jgi:hypothetical protein